MRPRIGCGPGEGCVIHGPPSFVGNKDGVVPMQTERYGRSRLGDRCHGMALIRAAHAYLQIVGQLHLKRSEEHTSELQSLMRISYAVFCLTKKKTLTTISKAPQTTHKHLSYT